MAVSLMGREGLCTVEGVGEGDPKITIRGVLGNEGRDRRRQQGHGVI